ncbi:hypothetical protein O181_004773 [Austropuccinia psidii MF-1]|uniref:Uncharacterized protein n=1 Tax=Austropuccinia psidii MF-1 TaxID=1389203 RepID=A0A9Q3BHA2_9BASI|nr:hypothetical protein [Austropuccinia psidii MF-1]
MPGYETGKREKFKLERKRRWGKISHERRYKLLSITELFTNIQQEGGTKNMTQYRTFIGEYESIINYLKRYQYIQGDININKEILASIPSSVQESIYKEMIEDKEMVQALDGGYIIPRFKILKIYIEQDLKAKVSIQKNKFSQGTSREKKSRLDNESWEEVFKKIKYLPQRIKNPEPQENQSKEARNKSVKEVFNQLQNLSEVVEYSKKTH